MANIIILLPIELLSLKKGPCVDNMVTYKSFVSYKHWTPNLDYWDPSEKEAEVSCGSKGIPLAMIKVAFMSNMIFFF